MNSTSTLDFPKQVVLMFQDAIEQGTLQAYRMIWAGVRDFVFQNWGTILLVLLGLFIIAIAKFLITGRWGMLASLMYRVLYLTGLFVIALVFGPDIFTNWWFDIVLIFLYVACFETVGYFLRKSGIRRYR